jgi:hypothetical protein
LGVYLNLREFNVNTTKISYINGCEIIDKQARQDLDDLVTSQIVAMGTADFVADNVVGSNMIEFYYHLGSEDNDLREI